MSSLDPHDPDVRRALESLLRWYVAMGVDAAIDDEPHDRFTAVDTHAPRDTHAPSLVAHAQEPIRRVLSRESPGQDQARPAADMVPASAEAQIREAEAIAARATSLDDLRAAWEAFPGCALAATAARMIFAGGNPRARVMILGPAPGSDDERHGTAFSGPAGRLVDGMLAAIGLSRDTAYLANVIPWRPPGNRAPTPLEAALCLPFTRKHIELANPALILCLGERAAQLLLDTRDPLAKLRGRCIPYQGERATARLTVTLSLDYLLSQPLQKKRAWVDLLAFAKMLDPIA